MKLDKKILEFKEDSSVTQKQAKLLESIRSITRNLYLNQQQKDSYLADLIYNYTMSLLK